MAMLPGAPGAGKHSGAAIAAGNGARHAGAKHFTDADLKVCGGEVSPN
jgi:hypothetical protein